MLAGTLPIVPMQCFRITILHWPQKVQFLQFNNELPRQWETIPQWLQWTMCYNITMSYNDNGPQ